MVRRQRVMGCFSYNFVRQTQATLQFLISMVRPQRGGVFSYNPKQAIRHARMQFRVLEPFPICLISMASGFFRYGSKVHLNIKLENVANSLTVLAFGLTGAQCVCSWWGEDVRFLERTNLHQFTAWHQFNNDALHTNYDVVFVFQLIRYCLPDRPWLILERKKGWRCRVMQHTNGGWLARLLLHVSTTTEQSNQLLQSAATYRRINGPRGWGGGFRGGQRVE